MKLANEGILFEIVSVTFSHGQEDKFWCDG